MSKMNLKTSALLVSLVLCAFAAQAEETVTTIPQDTTAPAMTTTTTTAVETPVKGSLAGRPSLGLRAGYVNTEGKQRDSMDFGVETGYRVNSILGTAVELGGYSTPRLTDGTASLSRLQLLAKATFHPTMGNIPVVKYMNLGVGAGPVFSHVGNLKVLSLGVAPQLGIDVPATAFSQSDSQYTVGFQGSYTFVSRAMADYYSVGGVAKYWF